MKRTALTYFFIGFLSFQSLGQIGVATSTLNVSCAGGNDGSILVSAFGGVPPYTYIWNTGSTDKNLFSLTAGTYAVTVTDDVFTVFFSTNTVSQPAFLTSGATITNVSCNGLSDGYINITPSGGTPPYLYSWSNGTTSEDISNLSAGNYCVVITDKNGCGDSICFTITQPTDITVSGNISNVGCNGGNDGSINITPSGGNAPYTHKWNVGPSTEDISGLTPLTYCVTTTDGSGCKDLSCFIVNNPYFSSDFNFTSGDTTCLGDSVFISHLLSDNKYNTIYYIDFGDGNVSSGMDTMYLFSHVYTNTGNYAVEITLFDTLCGAVDSTIKALSIINCNCVAYIINKQNVSCTGANDGAVTVSACGNAAPYTYIWNTLPPQISPTATGLSLGTYVITVTDSAGVKNTQSILISEPNPLTLDFITGLYCDQSDEEIQASVNGGTKPYLYNWSINITSSIATGLTSGTYSVTVTDQNGCMIDSSISITEIIGVKAGFDSISNVTCFGGYDGSATITIYGGKSPITYKWNTGATSAQVSSLSAGIYTVTVSDNNACEDINSVTITSLTQVNIGGPTVMFAKCFGESSGWASISGNTGGIKPYSYKWSNGNMDSLAENLSAGSYQVTLTDANGCMDQISFAVGENSEIIISSDIINILCKGSNDASINVSVAGGAGSYNYKWDNGATVQYISNLSSGLYILTVADFFNCQKSDSIYINDSSGILKINPFIINVSCKGGSDGTAIANVIGGVSPYNYYWSNGSTTNMITGLAANTFMITVIDQKSCKVVDTITVTEPGSGCGRNAIISGTIFYDLNYDCVLDSGEIGLNGWVVLANPGPYYGITNNGYYELRVDTGDYTISVIPPIDLMMANCYTIQSVNISGINDTIKNINFPFLEKFICPLLSIDISVNSFRRCSQFKYFIEVCNNGVVDADSTIIKITFDKDFIPVLSNPISWDPFLSGFNDYYFYTGLLKAGKCTNFWVRVQSDCSPQLGETRCATAEILNYNSNCIFPKADTSWDKSSVKVDGFCKNDSLAHFVITNTGNFDDGDMDAVSVYRIFVNNILALTNTFQISGGDSLVIEFPANGNTIRLEADQRPGHPGKSYPRATIESCGTDSSGNVHLGLFNAVPEDDASPYIETFCTEITGSYDPNDKMVMPKGLYNQNYISKENNLLEYIIRFQNTGNDTAIHIVLRDTLPPFLDVTTLDVGTSSHDYKFELYNKGIMVWKFDSIMLPDSNVNEEASHGSVNFKIAFKDSLPQKTKIENRASIYFDINDPVVTNTAFVTVFDTLVIDTTLLFPYFCDKPIANFVITIDTLSSLYEIAFIDSSQFSKKYLWNFGDGKADTIINTSHTFGDFGVYNVCLTVYNECGIDSMCKTLALVDGIADRMGAIVIYVFPNPNNGEFFINLPNIKTNYLNIELLDIAGRILYTKNYKSQNGNFTQKLSMESFSKGVYYLKVVSDNSVMCKKIVYK